MIYIMPCESFPRPSELHTNPVLQDVYDEIRAASDGLFLGEEEEAASRPDDFACYENGALQLTQVQIAELYAEGPPPAPNFREYDAALASRRRAINALCKGGARIRGGILRITDEQYEQLGGTRPLIDQAPTAPSGDADGSALEMVHATSPGDNHLELRTSIATTLASYGSLFDSRLPSAETNKRTWLRHSLKESDPIHWRVKQDAGHMILDHRFTMHYSTGEEANQISCVRNVILASEAMPIVAEYHYAQNVLARIELDGTHFNATTDQLYAGTVGSGALGALLELTCPNSWGVNINLGSYVPSISVENSRPDNLSPRNNFQYVYDPKLNAFILKGQLTGVGKRGEVVERPRFLSVRDFLEIVDNSINILPLGERWL